VERGPLVAILIDNDRDQEFACYIAPGPIYRVVAFRGIQKLTVAQLRPVNICGEEDRVNCASSFLRTFLFKFTEQSIGFSSRPAINDPIPTFIVQRFLHLRTAFFVQHRTCFPFEGLWLLFNLFQQVVDRSSQYCSLWI